MSQKISTKIVQQEKALAYDVDFEEIPPDEIVAFNELRSTADLVRLYKSKILEIQPEFQREIVWKESDQTRFIDSLVKKLPIPSMCFSLDYKTEEWQVIDGLQRTNTIIKFFEKSGNWKMSKLKDIDKSISDKTVKDIKKNSKKIYERISNAMLPITVIRCDYTKKTHTRFLFTIFHRLNTGGTKLNNQEIRNCIYNGSFNTFMKECNNNANWKKLLSIKEDKTYRFIKIELILRFFAFYYNLKGYNGKLTSFLNDYMELVKDMDEISIQKNKRIFQSSVDLIYNSITNKKALEKTSNAFMDALMYGVFKNIETLKNKQPITLRKYYNRLKANRNFSEENLSESIMKKEKVFNRLKAAEKIFSGK
jgi:hypothetical protein